MVVVFTLNRGQLGSREKSLSSFCSLVGKHNEKVFSSVELGPGHERDSSRFLIELEFLAWKRRWRVEPLHHGLHFRLQEQRFSAGGGQFVRAFLQRGHNVRMVCGGV